MKLTENNFLITLRRTLKLSLTNVKRNGLMSVGVIAVIAIIIIIFNVLLTINLVASSAIKDIGSKVDFTLYLKNDVNPYEAQRMVSDIKGISGVKSVEFISKEEAFDTFRKNHPDTADFFQKYNLKNPLPPNIHILAENPEYYSYIEKLIKDGRYSSLLENISEQKVETSVISKISDNLKKITSFTKHVLGWVIAVFIIGGAFIINSALIMTIHSRRTEINIMKLVGAKPIFVKLPFIFEAMWYAITATIAGFFVTSILLWSNFLGGFGAFSETDMSIAAIFVLEIIGAIIIAVGGSLWSVHRHIKKHFLR